MKYQSRFSRIFFPERCSRCGKIIPIYYTSCPSCEERVTVIGDSFCQHCGKEIGSCLCKDNISISLPHVAGVYIYSDDIREKIHAMKFRKRRTFAYTFAEDMAKRVNRVYSDVSFDAVTFVPMIKKDEKLRGYNQSRLLAKALAQTLSVPLRDCLEKTRSTKKQHTLTGEERKDNLKGSFSLSTTADVAGKTILLCDDIKTTGATLSECVNVLLAGGAKDVYCICIALSDYKGSRT